MRILELRLDDAVMSDLEDLCAELRLDIIAAAGEAVRRYIATERTRAALGSSELIAAYAALTNEADDEFEDADLDLSTI